jgi:GT2 family glycosyltransferase
MLYETDNFIFNSSPLVQAISLLKSREDLAAIGFTVEKLNGQKVVCGNRFPSILSFVLGQQISYHLKLYTTRISAINVFNGWQWYFAESVFTSPLIIKIDDWRKVEGMDERLFPFCDSDTDLCWKLLKAGKRTAVLQVSQVIHDNKNMISTWSERRVLDHHRARFSLLLKHRGGSLYCFVPLIALRHFFELVLLSFKDRSIKKIKGRWTLLLFSLSAYKNQYSGNA